MFNKKIFLLIGIFLLVFTPTVIALRVNFGAEVGEFTINTWTNLTELNQMEDLFNSLFSAKTTDDLTQGSSNLYDDTDWNKTYADTLYSTIDEPLWTANFTAYNSSWSSTYNASYVPYTGATQNVDLGANNLSVDGSTLFVDTSTNRVGIGTATPNKEIHIFKDASTSVGIRMENNDTTNGGVLIGFDNGEDMLLYNYGIRGINFGTRGLERMRIAHDGKVGIGTISPNEKLEVAGKVRVTGSSNAFQLYRDGSSQSGYIQFYDTDGGLAEALIGYTGANDNFYIQQSNNAPMYLRTNSATRLTILADGKVGIGTTTPNAKLDINSDKIIIQNSKTPSSASDTGTTGSIAWDSSYIYICTATDTWKRTAIATW